MNDNWNGRGPSMAATRAEAVQLEAMGLDDEAVFRSDLLLQSLDLAVLKLHDGAATGTDQMVVMPLMGDIVVLRLRTEMAGLSDAGVAKQVQRAVNRGEPEVGIFFGQLMVHGLRRDVFLPEKRRENELTLARQLELMLRQVLPKHLHFFRRFIHDVRYAEEADIKNESAVEGQEGSLVKNIRWSIDEWKGAWL